MTGTECFQAALTLLGETTQSAEYYRQFSLGAINQLLCNCLREINALRLQQGLTEFSAPPHLQTLSDPIPADEALARECFPYGLAAILSCDDDKDKFNWAGSEFSTRLLAHCPATMTAIQEMI